MTLRYKTNPGFGPAAAKVDTLKQASTKGDDMNNYRQLISDVMGALQPPYASVFDDTVTATPTTPPTLGPGELLPWFSASKGQVFVTEITGDGAYSGSIESGSGPMCASLDPTFPSIEGVTTCGSGQTGILPVRAGQKVYIVQNAADVQRMRASVGTP